MKANNLLTWILFAIVIVLSLLLFKQCTKVILPDVKTVKEQIKVVEKDISESRKLRDSFNVVLSKLEKIKSIAVNDLTDLKNKSNEIRKHIDTIYSEPKVNEYITLSDLKDKKCDDIISNFEREVIEKNKLIDANELAYQKQLTNLRTAFEQQKKLQPLVLKPKNKIYIGVSSNVYPAFGYGVDLGLQNKKGTIFEIRVLQMQGKNYGQVSIKKTLW